MRALIAIPLLLSVAAATCGPGRNPFAAADGGTDAAADAGPVDEDGGDALGDGPAPDGHSDGAGGDPEADAGAPDSRCTVTRWTVACPHRSDWLATAAPGFELRQVHWQVPLGQPPAAGWPAAVFFQGTAFSSQYVWSGLRGEVYGAFHQARTMQQLLDAGVAVVAPEAHLQGSTWWDTNIAPFAQYWTSAPDHALMLALLEAIDAGRFGPLDPERLFAFGFSSGGYMTSRVGLAYPGRFRALAICSASYATCSSSLCAVPASQPDTHPPTLFLHGLLDAAVPEWTMRAYERSLRRSGIATRVITDALAGHQWLPAAPEAIGTWFAEHDPGN